MAGVMKLAIGAGGEYDCDAIRCALLAARVAPTP